MKIIQSGDTYNLYDDSIKTYDMLPPGTYTVEYDDRSNSCYLRDHAEILVTEKAYGVQDEKVEKVLDAFDRFERSLGIILSGDKGIGKTMFAKKLCVKAKECGIPVILVEKFYPGLVRFIEKFDQECIVLFDEFDKTFTADNDCDDDYDNDEKDGQARLLSLFDGTSGGKKLFIVTCNDLYGLNDCLLNRPGRFHYHFRFEYPSDSKIEEYMTEKLHEKYHGEIPNVIAFAKKAKLNYDCLRAIAFELNLGEKFQDAILDLNIINTDDIEYDITLYFENGKKLYRKRISLDLFDEDEDFEWISFYNNAGKFGASLKFNKAMIEYRVENNDYIIYSDGIAIDEDDTDPAYEGLNPSYITFARSKAKNLHYFG